MILDIYLIMNRSTFKTKTSLKKNHWIILTQNLINQKQQVKVGTYHHKTVCHKCHLTQNYRIKWKQTAVTDEPLTGSDQQP